MGHFGGVVLLLSSTPSNASPQWVISASPVTITISLDRARPFNGPSPSHVSSPLSYLVTTKVFSVGSSGMRIFERRLGTQVKVWRVLLSVFSKFPGSNAPRLQLNVLSNLGCFTGCILAFLGCERTGRRWAMWIAMGFIIVRLNLV